MHSEESAENKEAGDSRVQAIKLVAYMDDLLILAEDKQTCRLQIEKLRKEMKTEKNPEGIDADTKAESTSPDESQKVGI